jgi:PsbP-like protein/PsbP
MHKVILSGLLVVTMVLSLFPAVLSGFTLQIATAQQNSTSITSTHGNSTNFLTYSNSTFGIKIHYPSNWIKQESQNQSSNDIVKFSSPAATVPASLAITGGKPAPQIIPLQVYINASIYVLRHSFDNFSLIESNSTNLAGFPAHEFVYTAIIPSSGLEVKFMQILTIKDSKSFVITFGTLPTDFSTYLPTVQKMIDSFAFIPVTTPATAQSTNATTTSAPPLVPKPNQNTSSVPAAAAVPVQSSNKTYTNATDGITISVPQGWSTEEGQNKANATDLKVVYVNPPIALDPEAAVSVTIYKDTQPSSNSSVDGYLRDTIVFYRGNIPDFKLGSANTGFSLSGQPAYLVMYTWTSSDTGAMKTMEIGMLLNGKGYYIHYSATTQLFSKFLPQVNQIIGSFKVQPPS